ncbi:MAG: hypothetical protein HDS73_06850 [Bacteroidales bacterium]|nr:hypothetical protein [Bacteroidales bacterium]
MKKIAFLMMAIGLVLGLGSCSEDRDPVYKAPTTFVLNTPAMQDQFIELTAGQVLELVASQPDYGYSAVANYSAQMSLTEDFTESYDLEATDGTANLARFVVKQEDVAAGLCKLKGLDSEEAFNAAYPDGVMKPEKIYFRAVCELSGVESSRILSNVVSYNQVLGYFAIPTPGYIYLIGDIYGDGTWIEPSENNAEALKDWRLFEADDAIGSKVYTGIFDIPRGDNGATFRFYTALTGWSNGDSYGSQVDDSPIEYPEFDGGSFTTTAVNGKGSFNFPNWQGGLMTITVDMSDRNNITVTVQAGSHSVVTTKYIYLIGSINGWPEPTDANEVTLNPYRIADTTGDGIYTGEFAYEGGDLYFRFSSNLGGWDNSEWIGTNTTAENLECQFSNGQFGGSYVAGNGNWFFPGLAAGKLSVSLDTNSKTVSFGYVND